MTMKATILAPLLTVFLVCALASATDHPEYSAFSVPEDFFVDDSIRVTDTVIYKTGWYSVDGAAWQPFTLQGVKYATSDAWLSGTATASLPASFSGPGEHYVLAYSCNYNDEWDCHGGKWQLHLIDNEVSGDVFYVVENNIGRAQIIISESAPNTVKLAASYLQEYINNMTGALLPIKNVVDENIPFKIFLGQSDYTDDLGVNDNACEYGSFKMVSGEDYLVLLGNDDVTNITGPHSLRGRGEVPGVQDEWDAITGEHWDTPYSWAYKRYNPMTGIWETDNKGTINAVYEFLYDQGIRWYYPGAIGTIIPTKKDIFVSKVNKHVKPDFAMRQYEMYYHEYYTIGSATPVDELKYQLSLRTNMGDVIGLPIDHGTKHVILRDEVKTAHPEYYAIWDGVRMNGDHYHPDLCSEGLFTSEVGYVRAMFDVYDDPSVSVMPTDGFYPGVSESSPECLAKRTSERGLQGHLSDYVWEYVNNVALEVYKTHPDKKIHTDAYAGSLLTPIKIDMLSPNIVVFVARTRALYNNNPEREAFNNNLANEWLEILPSNEIYLREYYILNRPGTIYESIPAFFPHTIARDLKHYKGISRGEYVEVNRNYYVHDLAWDTYAANALNVYVTSRLYWDTDQDIDDLLDEYYELFYGPASQKMKAFVEYAEANYAEATRNPQILLDLRQMATEARAIAGDTIYGERIDLLIGLMNSRYVGEETTIDSCMELDSPSTIYKLTRDVSSTGTCFTFATNGVTLDCQGHTITYATTPGNYHGVFIQNHRGLHPKNFFTITNCVIENGDHSAGPAIYAQSANNGVIENNIINVADSENSLGIHVLSSNYVDVIGNTVESAGTPLYLSFLNDSFVANNNATTSSNKGMYLSYSHNNTLRNNIISSDSDYGVHVTASTNNNFTDNIIESATGNGLWLYHADDNSFFGNTALSANAIGLRLYASNHRNTFVQQTAIGGTYGIEITSSSENVFEDCQEIIGGTQNLRTENSNNEFINCSY